MISSRYEARPQTTDSDEDTTLGAKQSGADGVLIPRLQMVAYAWEERVANPTSLT